MPVYTKGGDRGMTGTCLGKKISKSSKLIYAIGTVDELNSFLGIVGGLEDIQKNLFTINAILAGSKICLSKDAIIKLEKEIDRLESKTPKLTNFIIYGGSKKASLIYFARALCRRTERSLVKLNAFNYKLEILAYMNRLSDYLFILARYENYKKKVKEAIWK